MNIQQTCFLYGIANVFVVRGHKQFDRVVRRGLKGGFGCLAVGQKFAHGDDGEHADEKTEQPRDGGCQHVHRRTCGVFI